MKKALIFIVAICLLCCAVTVTAAEPDKAADSRETVISAEVPASHTVTVTTDNAQVEFNGVKGNSFEAPRLTEFTISVKCDSGYKVKKILLNGEDVTNAYSDGKITLSGIYEASRLEIITEKLANQNGDNSSGQSDLTSPQTGDNGYSYLSMFLLIILLCLTTVAYISKKRLFKKK